MTETELSLLRNIVDLEEKVQKLEDRVSILELRRPVHVPAPVYGPIPHQWTPYTIPNITCKVG